MAKVVDLMGPLVERDEMVRRAISEIEAKFTVPDAVE
jgi:hypothetical protein